MFLGHLYTSSLGKCLFNLLPNSELNLSQKLKHCLKSKRMLLNIVIERKYNYRKEKKSMGYYFFKNLPLSNYQIKLDELKIKFCLCSPIFIIINKVKFG